MKLLLLTGLIGLMLAGLWIGLWIGIRRISRLRARVEEMKRLHDRRFYPLQRRVSQVESAIGAIEFDRRRERGEIRFEPEMTLGELMAVHPRVREILAFYGLTRDRGSHETEDSTLARACADAGVDAQQVLEALYRFAADPSHPIAGLSERGGSRLMVRFRPSRN
jgi:hypothetical protein